MQGIAAETRPPEGLGRRSALGDAYRRVGYPLRVALASRAAVYLMLAIVGWWTRSDGQTQIGFDTFFSPLGRWDASWYRWIALHGYDTAGANGHHANVVAFSPLYPIAYRIVSAYPAR